MDRTTLYRQIAESVRQDILCDVLKPGAPLPSVRKMAAEWHCTPGTVQHAYRELADQGLVISRPGQGTHVIAAPHPAQEVPLRRAGLVHKAEEFLLESLTAGFTPIEIEEGVRLAMDRWRALSDVPKSHPDRALRFVGSHDPAVALIADRFPEITRTYNLSVSFTGSLGGMMALAQGEADLAGSHLWDEEDGTYNEALARRLFSGIRTALVTLAHRRLGLIASPGNPLDITTLKHLTRSGVRFINRQRGAGTRVWLDAHLRREHVSLNQITGYTEEARTHSEVARLIAEEQANVGLGIESAALSYGLDFVLLTKERYDLVMSQHIYDSPPIRDLIEWIRSAEGREAISALGGYDTSNTGDVSWIGACP